MRTGARRAFYGGLSLTMAALLLGVLLAANYLSARYFYRRFNLTTSQEFTVAPATREVLASLEDVVNVKAFLSSDLPPQAATIPARIRNLLFELEGHANGNLRIEELDPDSDPAIERRALGLGITRLPLAVIEENKQQTVEVFLALAVLYADQSEVVHIAVENMNLEYELVRAILRVTRPKKTIGFLTGHDERDVFGDYRTLYEVLRRQYNVETVDLTGGNPVPERIAALVVGGPRRQMDDRSRYEVDQYLMRGGSLFVLHDPFQINPQSLQPKHLETGFLEQLASYGIRVKKALVADWARGAQEVVQLQGLPDSSENPRPYVLEYPLWPRVLEQNIHDTHPIISQLRNLVLPWTAPLEVVQDEDDRFEVTVLGRSTVYAVAETTLFSVNPRVLRPPPDERYEQFVLAAVVTGPQRSFFAGQPIPGPEAASGDDPIPAPAPPAPAERRDATESARIIVLGGSELASSSVVAQPDFFANIVFLQNAIDWLAIGAELIDIRSRVSNPPYLDPERRQRGERIVPFANLALMPALVIAFGMLWRWARRNRRVVLE